MMGRPKGSTNKPKVEEEEVKGYEGAAWAVATVLQERCGIMGCGPKIHLDEANYLLKKFRSLGILREED